MTLYKILAPDGKTPLATVNCEMLEPLEGKNKFEVIGAGQQAVGLLSLTERCTIQIVGGGTHHA